MSLQNIGEKKCFVVKEKYFSSPIYIYIYVCRLMKRCVKWFRQNERGRDGDRVSDIKSLSTFFKDMKLWCIKKFASFYSTKLEVHHFRLGESIQRTNFSFYIFFPQYFLVFELFNHPLSLSLSFSYQFHRFLFYLPPKNNTISIFL